MRNPRITITLSPAQADLLADLARLPRRDQAARIRDLAVIGLTLTRCAAVAVAPVQPLSSVPAAIQQATTPNPAPVSGKALGQRARVAAMKGRLFGGEA